MKKKRKKKNRIKYENFFYIIVIILVAVFLFKFLNNDDSSDNTINESSNSIKENTPVANVKTEEEIKLEKLGNINEKLDFFKMEYLDRYVNYKEKNPNLDNETVVVYVNIGLDQEFYTNVKDSPNKYTNIVLANKVYFLGSDYVPKNLTRIDANYSSGEKYMEKDAQVAFEEMAKAARNDGYRIRAVSTYRSYSYQEGLYNRYAASDGKEKADTYSARPGYSEHQTGLAVDVDNYNQTYTSFGNTKEFNWMKENAYKFGYILRYTKETEFITGYMNEPWHYRYVGKDIAKYIHEHPMTYEEYYVRFLDK